MAIGSKPVPPVNMGGINRQWASHPMPLIWSNYQEYPDSLTPFIQANKPLAHVRNDSWLLKPSVKC